MEVNELDSTEGSEDLLHVLRGKVELKRAHVEAMVRDLSAGMSALGSPPRFVAREILATMRARSVSESSTSMSSE